RDNTMNTINAYFEYVVNMRPNIQVGDPDQPYVTDVREITAGNIPNIPNGAVPPQSVRWIQYKIPILETAGRNEIGSPDIRTINFMRIFLTGFQENLTLRFGSLDLVRGEWRRYTSTLDQNDQNIQDDGTTMDILAVNIQENERREPIPYVTPPGVVREQLNNN